MKPIFLTVITALVLISCSIEKRHYTSGFHVDWHRDKNVKHIPKLQHAAFISDTLVSFEVALSKKESSSETTLNQESNTEKTIINPLVIESKKTLVKKEKNDHKLEDAHTPHAVIPLNDPPAAIQNSYAKKSAFFGVMAWLLPIFDLVLITNIGSVTIGLAIILGLTILICAILAISYGNTALRQIDLNPGKYSNRGQAKFGKTLGTALFIILGVLFIYGLTVVGF